MYLSVTMSVLCLILAAGYGLPFTIFPRWPCLLDRTWIFKHWLTSSHPHNTVVRQDPGSHFKCLLTIFNPLGHIASQNWKRRLAVENLTITRACRQFVVCTSSCAPDVSLPFSVTFVTSLRSFFLGNGACIAPKLSESSYQTAGFPPVYQARKKYRFNGKQTKEQV